MRPARYREFLRLQDETVWQELTALGARPQRLLWASTLTKNPANSDLRYVDPQIGPHTVNTMTQDTLVAYRHHGEPNVRIEEDLAPADVLVAQLAAYGIDLEQVAAELYGSLIRRTRCAGKWSSSCSAVIDPRQHVLCSD